MAMTVNVVPTHTEGPRTILETADANLGGQPFQSNDRPRDFTTTYVTGDTRLGWIVRCPDGRVRHRLFSLATPARHWAEWGHFCLAAADHDVRALYGA
jgi:hypothetical protein